MHPLANYGSTEKTPAMRGLTADSSREINCTLANYSLGNKCTAVPCRNEQCNMELGLKL